MTTVSDTENKAVQSVQTVQLTQRVLKSEYHLNSIYTVELMHSFLLPSQCNMFVYLAKLSS